ncbi:MAG: 4a-hydroxytetrahydrobiopterin dehydratase [Ignavibacteriae bacterium]|nr:4a-hydroxytetrahydrobiopterin dehydratase [Ignavibacteriota bacterium]
MGRYILLTEEEIRENLEEVNLWNQEGNAIIREIAASNFPAAIGVVNAIAVLAESSDHHPDILIYGWNKVRIKITTHATGGLTIHDFELAKKIDKLNY